ncbi:hypothetical protein [Oligoflexus tunisiensis]|uniref:hypothetical protein n=1 Tax=Oligoflexus tunisiensis TaxID=708132 RepID=UPI00114CC180|nr:hypothetical protein [Oligoflexus tunisiensis]
MIKLSRTVFEALILGSLLTTPLSIYGAQLTQTGSKITRIITLTQTYPITAARGTTLIYSSAGFGNDCDAVAISPLDKETLSAALMAAAAGKSVTFNYDPQLRPSWTGIYCNLNAFEVINLNP